MKIKTIYFAGGCFWGTEHYFKQVRGVVATQVGYANGRVPESVRNDPAAQAAQKDIAAQSSPWSPTYEEVYTDTTGFAEAVQLKYDPEQVSLRLLGELFFRSIDPTSLNRQGNDVGTRYRTGVYYTNPEDRKLFESLFREVEQTVGAPLAVELEPLQNFYPAEEYHQDYLDKHPEGYCHLPWALMQFAKEANAEESR